MLWSAVAWTEKNNACGSYRGTLAFLVPRSAATTLFNVQQGLSSSPLTCGDFYAGILAHVPQLDDNMVFSTRFQFVKAVLHSTVARLDFVAPVGLPDQIFHSNCVELRQREEGGSEY